MPFGVKKVKFEISPLLPPKKRKNWDFKLAVNKNCSRPNSVIVSHIHLKLGTGIERPSASRDMTKVKRLKVKVTR